MRNQIWGLDQTFTNYLLPQQKLIAKQRNGAKVHKRYDRAKTPARRALDHSALSTQDRARIAKAMRSVRPGELSQSIADLTTRLERLALSKAPAPVKPRVNRSFNESRHPEVFGEATN
ncbi:MAG: hypothetical protein ACRDOE_27310 [Streptosporangiaceae bacterium]